MVMVEKVSMTFRGREASAALREAPKFKSLRINILAPIDVYGLY
jgi:hypothetical protein